MSFLVYSDTEPKTAFTGSLSSINPNRAFKNHLENWFFLKLTLRNGNMIDRHQASKELAICDRKLEYWQRKPEFDMKQAEKDIAELRSRWQEPDTLNLKR